MRILLCIMLFFLIGYTQAQINVLQNIRCTHPIALEELIGAKIYCSDNYKDTVQLEVFVQKDSVEGELWYKCKLKCDSSIVMFEPTNKQLLEAGLVDSKKPDVRRLLREVPDGNYSIGYVVSQGSNSDTVWTSIYKGKREKQKLITPHLDLSVMTNYSFYIGETPTVPNRNLTLFLKGGIEYKGIPLSLDFNLNSDYKTVSYSYTPCFLGFDANTFKGGIDKKVLDMVKSDELSKNQSFGKLSNLQEEYSTIRNLGRDSSMVSGADYLKKVQSLQSFMGDSNTVRIDSATFYSKVIEKYKQLSLSRDSIGKLYALDSSGVDSFVSVQRDTMKRIMAQINKVDSFLNGGKGIIKGLGDSLGSFKMDTSAIKNMYSKYTKQYSAMKDSFTNYKKYVDPNAITSLTKLIKNDSVRHVLDTLVSSGKKYIKVRSVQDLFGETDQLKNLVFKSKEFSFLQKALYSIKSLKVGRFTTDGPKYFLGNSNLLGIKAEFEIKNIYLMFLYGKDQQNPFLFRKYFNNKNSILAAGVGFHLSDKNFIHLLFKRGTWNDTTESTGVMKYNYVLGQNTVLSTSKYFTIQMGTYFSSTSVRQTSTLNLSNPKEIDVLKNVFRNKDDRCMWGINNEVQVKIDPHENVSFTYQNVVISPAYYSQGYYFQNTNQHINKVGMKLTLFKNKLTFQSLYTNITPLKPQGNNSSYKSDNLTTTLSLNIKSFGIQLTNNWTLLSKQLVSVNSMLNAKYSHHFRFTTFSHVGNVSINKMGGFTELSGGIVSNASYSFTSVVRKTYVLNVLVGVRSVTQSTGSDMTFTSSFSCQAPLKKIGAFSIEERNVVEKNSMRFGFLAKVSLALAKSLNGSLNFGVNRYINKPQDMRSFYEFPLALNLNYRL